MCNRKGKKKKKKKMQLVCILR